jgi:uncharacterized membrane protein
MLVFLLGLILFLGIHSVRMVAPQWRDARYAALGEQRWKGLYSIASLAGLVLLVWGYALARPYAPEIYEPAMWMKHINAALMLPVMILLVASNLGGSYIRNAVKHPMLVAVKLWAVGHLLANGDLVGILLFGSFLAWAAADRVAVKRRAPLEMQAPAVRNDIISLVAGTIVYALFVWKLHLWLFGVPPIPA